MADLTSTELGAAGRYVYFDQAALDDLGAQTCLAYCRPTGSGENSLGYLYAKNSATVSGPRFFINHNAGSPFPNCGASSSTKANFPARSGVANSAVYNSWGHYAFTWDGGLDSTNMLVYSGIGADLSNVSAADAASNDGSGVISSDAAIPACLMNRHGLGRAFVGDVAYIAVWDRVLSLTELRNAQNNGPLAEPTGLVLLWANQDDLGPNALTETGRSTYVAGALPPNTTLGGSTAVNLDGAAQAVATAAGEFASSEVSLSGSASATATATGELTAGQEIVVSDDFERSSINVALSTVSGSGDAAVITLRPRVQESEVVSSQTRWLFPVAKITGVNGARPTFRFDRFRADVAGGYHYGPWDAGRKPMFSYDLETWYPFDTATINNTGDINTGYIEFRHNAAFVSDVVYVSKSWVRTVAQTGAWIDGLEASYPSLIHTLPSTVSGFVSGTFSAQTDELGRTIPAQPFYGFKVSDSSLVPDAGDKKIIAFVGGVHAGEDQANRVLEAAVEFILSADPKAQNIRKHFDVCVYPMLNAPGRAGGGWRGSFTQGASGIDDANRHFSDASPALEIVTLPRTAMQTDMPGTVTAAVDFHGTLHNKYSFYRETGNVVHDLFDSALEVYMGAGVVADEGTSPPGSVTVSQWFENVKGATLAVTSETADPTPLTDAQIIAWGEAHAKAISDLQISGAFGVPVPLAAAGLSVATASGALSVSIPLSGTAQSSATASGNLSAVGGASLSGNATATANASGGLSLSIPLSASAVAQAMAQAGVSTIKYLYGETDLRAKPASTLVNDGWSIVPVGQDAAYALAEPTPDATMVSNGTGGELTLALEPVPDPGTNLGHRVVVRLLSTDSGMCNVVLNCGDTVVTSQLITSLPNTWTDYELEISEAEAANITDYSDLRLTVWRISGLVAASDAYFSVANYAVATGSLSQATTLAGSAAGAASTVGDLTIQVSLSGAAISTAFTGAGLTTSAANQVDLAGAAQAQSSASGSLTHNVPLSGASLAVSSADGSLTQLVSLSGSAASASHTTGGLDVSVALNGAALAEAMATAGLVVAGGFTAAALAEATASGAITLRVNLDGAAVAQAMAAGALSMDGLMVAGTPGFIVSRMPRTWHVTRTKRTWKVSA